MSVTKKISLLFFSVFIVTTVAGSRKNNSLNIENEIINDTIKINTMNIKVGDKVFTTTLVENSSTEALLKDLSKGPITIQMSDYGNMEKVGSLGKSYPRNDKQITTEAGDIILYHGNALVIYYAPNFWNFTRLGKVDNVSPKELKAILGSGSVSVTLSLEKH